MNACRLARNGLALQNAANNIIDFICSICYCFTVLWYCITITANPLTLLDFSQPCQRFYTSTHIRRNFALSKAIKYSCKVRNGSSMSAISSYSAKNEYSWQDAHSSQSNAKNMQPKKTRTKIPAPSTPHIHAQGSSCTPSNGGCWIELRLMACRAYQRCSRHGLGARSGNAAI